MDRKIGYIIFAFLSALLFFVAIGYAGWYCGESILGPTCSQLEVNRTTGGLLVTAGLLIVIAGLLLIVGYVKNLAWANTSAAVITTITAIIAIAGVFYYMSEHNIWSPIIAAMGMSFNIVLAGILLTDLASNQK